MSNSVDQIFTDELAALAKEGYSEAEIMEAAPMILAEVQKASGAPGPYRSGYQFPTQAQQQPKKTLDPLRNAILRNKIAKNNKDMEALRQSGGGSAVDFLDDAGRAAGSITLGAADALTAGLASRGLKAAVGEGERSRIEADDAMVDEAANDPSAVGYATNIARGTSKGAAYGMPVGAPGLAAKAATTVGGLVGKVPGLRFLLPGAAAGAVGAGQEAAV